MFTAEVFSTSVNGRLLVVKSDTSNLSVLIQINTDTGKDDLGGATMVLSFNKDVLEFPSAPVANQHFEFHNFSDGNYNTAIVTKPFSDKLLINIFLPSDNNNKGTVVSGNSGWTDLVTINFDIRNANDTARVNWLEGNLFWQIYDADNSTSWTIGNLTDLVYPLGIVSDVADNKEVPLKHSLEQNYPNPFNPTTVISYQLPVAGIVSLKIYDVLGNEVATLVDEYKSTGKYEVEFSAPALSSGIYLYKYQCGTYIETKKMVFLK